MISFTFRGSLAASKSLFNRALIIQSFFPALEIRGYSVAQDVLDMKNALQALMAGEKELWVGEGGTVLRFLLFCVSREPGGWILRGTKRLFSRPQQEGEWLLKQLGGFCTWAEDRVIVESQGWMWPKEPLPLRLDLTSQFASGLLLSCMNLDEELTVTWSRQDEEKASWSYFSMTIELLHLLQVPIHRESRGEKKFLTIPRKALPKQAYYDVEPDWSSLATLLVAAKIGGEVVIEDLSLGPYLQPDAEILRLFGFCPEGGFRQDRSNTIKTLNGSYQISHTESFQMRKATRSSQDSQDSGAKTRMNLCIKSGKINPFYWSFRQTPDLLPSLAMLAAFSEGDCVFTDFERAAWKESDRVSNTLKLLQLAGVGYSVSPHQMVIHGQGFEWTPPMFEFDPDQDHRMAMAVGLLKLRQPKISILHPEVVNKSFPEFWRILGISS